MAKVFISYKYADTNVLQIPGVVVNDIGVTTPRNYVDILEEELKKAGHICKAEKSSESLDGLTEDVIAQKLSDRIYDSTVTIVLVSKGMMDNKKEKEQWIPWEISYSLKENNRGGRVSATNAIIAVALPEINGTYDYFITKHNCPFCNTITWHTKNTFNIIHQNMFNKKNPDLTNCNSCGNSNIHTGNDHSYIKPETWINFLYNLNYFLDLSLERQKNIGNYEIKKDLN